MMKNLLKKASLTFASMCLVAGGLVSVGWAGQHAESSQSERLGFPRQASAKCVEKQEPMPDELEINGQKYKKVRIQCKYLAPPALGLECVD